MNETARNAKEIEDDREFDGLFRDFRYRRLVLQALLLVALLAGLVRLLAPPLEASHFDGVASAKDIAAAARAIAADPAERVVVLLGDSVLRDGALRARGYPDPVSKTVAAVMRRRLSHPESVAIYDLSMDGMLLPDAAAIRERVEALAGDRPLQWLIELDPRQLSRAWAAPEKTHSRDFLRADSDAFAAWRTFDWPLVDRLRRLGAGRNRLLDPDVAEGGDPALHRRRITPHYADPDLGLADRLAILAAPRRDGPPPLCFLTPIDADWFRGGEAMGRALARARAAFGAAVVAAGGRFHDADRPRLDRRHFLDHCHLDPEGNEILADRLMRAAGLPRSGPRLSAPTADSIFLENLGPGEGALEQRLGAVRAAVGRHEFDAAGEREVPLEGVRPLALLRRCGARQVRVETDRLVFSEGGREIASRPLDPQQPAASPRDLDFIDDRTLVVLTMAGAVFELPWEDACSGRLDAARALAAPTPGGGGTASLSRARGLMQDDRAPRPLPLRSPVALFVDRRLRLVLIVDLFEDGDRAPAVVWRLKLDNASAYALLPPDADGLPCGERPLAIGRPFLYDPETQDLFGVDGEEITVLHCGRLERFNWTYGNPPDPSGGGIVPNGATLGPRRGGEFRIGFLGSSVVGSSYPLDDRSQRSQQGDALLFSTLSLAIHCEQQLAAEYRDAPVRPRSLDLTTPHASILDQLAALHLRPDDDLDMAVLSLDGVSFDFDEIEAGAELGTALARLAREADGRPIAEIRAGFLPKAVFRGARPGPASREEAALELVAEIRSLGRRRAFRPVLLDLTTLGPAAGDRPVPTARLEQARAFLDAWREAGLTVLKGGGSRIALEPHGYRGDRHLRPRVLSALAREFLQAILPDIEEDLFRGARYLLDPARRPPVPPRVEDLGVRIGTSPIAADIFPENEGAHWPRVDRWRQGREVELLLDVDPRCPHPAWMQALHAFVRVVLPSIREGDRTRIRLVAFSARDEYGQGRRDSIRELGRFLIAPERLDEAVFDAVRWQAPGPSKRPSWLEDEP